MRYDERHPELDPRGDLSDFIFLFVVAVVILGFLYLHAHYNVIPIL